MTNRLEALRRDLLFARILSAAAVGVSLLLAGLVYQLSGWRRVQASCRRNENCAAGTGIEG
jgi:hypothetical protein